MSRCRHGSPAEVVETVLLRAAKPLPARDEKVNGEVPWRRESRKPGLPEASGENEVRASMYVQVREQAVNRVKICSLKRGETSRITHTIFTTVSGISREGVKGRSVLQKGGN